MHINTTYDQIDQSKINGKLFKPVHLYSYYISPEPKKINNYYQQLLYSECLITFCNDDRINMVSRCATQPFKKLSDHVINYPDDCFSTLFAFYISWFPDIDKEIKICGINNNESPLYMPNNLFINFNKIYKNNRKKLEEIWLPFYVKKKSKYIKEKYGKLELNMPIYNIYIDDNNE